MSAFVGSFSRRASTAGGIAVDRQDGWTVLSIGDHDSLEVPIPESHLFRGTAKSCTFWGEFPPFVPRPAAPFVQEFNRLANQEGWGKKKKRGYLAKALSEEIDFHSDLPRGLNRWRRLCHELGVSGEPESITRCKKILKHQFVNLYNLLDHLRNPEVPVVCFDSLEGLLQDIRKTGTFPRQCAKRDGCMNVLLRRT